MDHQPYRCLLYKNASMTLFESYFAIEKFIVDTRLAFIDQYKLFDLLKKLLPVEENQLTCQGFLSWLVWRFDQHEHEHRATNHVQPSFLPTTQEINAIHKKHKTTHSDIQQPPGPSNRNASPNVQEQIDRLQSIVLRLASTIDSQHQEQVDLPTSPLFYQTNIKREHLEDNETSELEIEDEPEDEISDIHLPSTSTTMVYPHTSIVQKSIMYQGRNMMKHLRPRTTLTSFARHVASDLFSREEIMAKMHVDHNNERDIFLRHCICTAWNLTEQELYRMWPKIRNALLQLRRDAIAGKCIRMTNKRQQESTLNSSSISDDDVESQHRSDLCR